MTTRRISWALMAVVLSMVALAPLREAALPGDEELDPLPVFGAVLPTGVFIGTLKIVACTLDETGHLHLTGVLNGTATRRDGAEDHGHPASVYRAGDPARSWSDDGRGGSCNCTDRP